MKKITILFVLAFVLSACAPGQLFSPTATVAPAPCNIQAADFIKQVKLILPEWNDAVSLAGSTSRIAIAAPISNLQAIKRKLDALDVPPCAASVQSLTSAYMKNMIDAYLAFSSNQGDSYVNRLFEQVKTSQVDSADALVKLETNN